MKKCVFGYFTYSSDINLSKEVNKSHPLCQEFSTVCKFLISEPQSLYFIGILFLVKNNPKNPPYWIRKNLNTLLSFVSYFIFPGSLILFDILSNQKDLASSGSSGYLSAVNGVVKDGAVSDKQVLFACLLLGRLILFLVGVSHVRTVLAS